MTSKSIIFSAILIVVLGGCAGGMNERQQSTAKGTALGAGAGAAVGAVIGAIAGDPGLGAGIGAGVGAIGGYIWSDRMQQQKEEMESATAGTGINVVQTDDNQLRLDIPSDISFDTGQAAIKPDMFSVLNSLASGLMNNANAQVTIVGHTDNTGSDAINDPLSVNRAASTRQYLASQGFPLGRINIDGRGSNEPIADNTTPGNRAKNRRVEVFVKEPGQEAQQTQQQPQQPQQPQSAPY